MNIKRIQNIIAVMQQRPQSISFRDLCRVCDHYFGACRQRGTSHRIYKTPWQGDPRINIQEHKGMAKAYQVKQVIMAIEKMEVRQ